MAKTKDTNERAMIFKLIDDQQADKLMKLISESQVFKAKAKHFPHVSVLAHLYVIDRLRCQADVIGSGSQGNLQEEIDSYLNHAYTKAVMEMIVFQQILDNFNTNFALIEDRVTFKAETKDSLYELFADVTDNYWRSRITGEYDAAKDVALIITSLMTTEPQIKQSKMFTRVLEAQAADYQRSHPKTKEITIPVTKAGDITLLLDYSFDNNKYDASYKLSNTKGKCIRLRKLFQKGTLEFLIDNVINPLTLCDNEIAPGTSVRISDGAYVKMGREHSNQIYKLNQAIRKHLDTSGGKKIQSFGQKENNITVYIKIKLTSLTKKEKFG